ncbi:unnamed protein product [Pipistrellus nathusii]|uniref:Uncharacterized protein n=1 Tax=Pipistrellus nathusii TaxID=59473 RepID=A0ABN9ZH39_PIPNA
MSGLHMWALRFLCLWQLVWLQVQAAPIPELSLDSVLLTSIPMGPSPQPVQAQQPTLPSLDRGLTITPEPTMVTDAVTQQQTIAHPKHPKMSLPYSESVHSLKPTLSQFTALSFNIKVAIAQQHESDAIDPAMTERSSTVNICKFCSCSSGTLSCLGFGKKQKLSKVPVPETSTYNGTFTIL